MFQKLYNHYTHDPLYRSSIYVMASTFVLAVLGFLFWMIIARTFKPEYVGIATTLISVQTLISLFGNLGFNSGLIRYLPLSKQRNDIINSSFIVTAFASVIISGIFLLGLHIFSPRLLFLQTNSLYIISFLIFMIFGTWNVVIESIFIAYRAPGNILLKNTLLSVLKLILPFLLISFGSYGIFASVSLAVLISCIATIGILIRKHNFLPRITLNTKALKEMAGFALGNYIAGFFYQVPGLLLPLFIVNFLHTQDAAYYYIASMILNLLTIIPLAATQAFFAEGSYNVKTLREQLKKATRIIFELLIPAVLIIFFFGNVILHFFGKDYEREAFQLVQLFSISSIFTSVILLGSALLRLRHKMLLLILSNIALCIAVFGCAFLFVSHGLIGVGIGWLIGQVLISLVFVKLLWSEMSKK